MSGGGVEAVRELAEQLAKTVDRAPDLTFDGSSVEFPPRSVYPVPIAHNVIPLQFTIVDDGSLETDEEQKYCNEARKILGLPDLAVTTTCVRVPSSPGTRPPSCASSSGPSLPSAATEVLRTAPGVELAEIPTPLMAAGRDVSYVGRIRQAQGAPNALALLRLGRQPAQGRRAQCRADRRGIAGAAVLIPRGSVRTRDTGSGPPITRVDMRRARLTAWSPKRS